MKCSSLQWVVSFCMAAGLSQCGGSRPNIVVIVADDLGIGDLGCYGNTSFSTANIDRLAVGGVRLTHLVSAASLCTPSRAALLTGRYPVRFGMQESDGGPVVFRYTPSTAGLPTSETTFASVLSEAGYRTQYVGKWHLGWSCKSWSDQCHGPLGHGFQGFFGLPYTLMEQGDTSSSIDNSAPFLNHILPLLFNSRFDSNPNETIAALWNIWLDTLRHTQYSREKAYNRNWWGLSGGLEKLLNNMLVRGNKIESWPYQYVGLTQRLVRESVDYIQRASGDSARPFLLVHSLVHPHTPMFTAPRFSGTSGHSRYADNVIEMDWAVGQLLDALDAAGVTGNTLVHFLSDHGADLKVSGLDGQREGGHNGVFRGGKGQSGMEGGVRVPGIFRWPDRLPAASEYHGVVSTLDLFPSLLQIAGAADGVSWPVDGVPVLDDLSGRAAGLHSGRFLVHYCGSDVHAVRSSTVVGSAVYKLQLKVPLCSSASSAHHCHEEITNAFGTCRASQFTSLRVPLLFDVAKDPSELVPIAVQDPRYKAHVPRMLTALEQHRQSVSVHPSQHDSFDAVMPLYRLMPHDQFFKFRGIDFDMYGHEDWLAFSQEFTDEL